MTALASDVDLLRTMTGIPDMTSPSVHNINVAAQKTLIAPADLRESVPVDDTVFEFVSGAITPSTRSLIETIPGSSW